MRIRIGKEEDRLTVAAVLFKNGYTVRPVRVKEGSKTMVYIEVSTPEKEVE